MQAMVRLASRYKGISNAIPHPRRFSFRPKTLDRTDSPPPALDYLSRPDAAPLHIAKPEKPLLPDVLPLLRRLAPPDLVVPVELGLFSHARSTDGSFEQYHLPFESYLDWLQRGAHQGTIDGNQVYLAQWDATGSIAGLADALGEPRWIGDARKDAEARGLRDAVDVYQKSFFLGPVGAMTPLHHDPHHNLFLLPSASHPTDVGKAFLTLPSFLEGALRTRDPSRQRNTSDLSIEFDLSSAAEPTVTFRRDDGTALDRAVEEQLEYHARFAIVREGEAVVIPKECWHCVKNVSLRRLNSAGQMSTGWTAGVGWWFRLRSGRDRLTT